MFPLMRLSPAVMWNISSELILDRHKKRPRCLPNDLSDSTVESFVEAVLPAAAITGRIYAMSRPVFA